MKKSTEELLQILKKAPDFETFISDESENVGSIPLYSYLKNLCEQKNMLPAHCIKGSGLDRNYGYQIFSGEKHPNRDKVLAICFGFPLCLEEIQSLLKATGYPILYAKEKRDSAIIFALQRNYSLIATNELLLDMGLKLIE